jgi:hypothetical protein
VGDPGWLTGELYDVVAKADQADLADWQKPAMRQTLLRAMLQAMLWNDRPRIDPANDQPRKYRCGASAAGMAGARTSRSAWRSSWRSASRWRRRTR